MKMCKSQIIKKQTIVNNVSICDTVHFLQNIFFFFLQTSILNHDGALRYKISRVEKLHSLSGGKN